MLTRNTDKMLIYGSEDKEYRFSYSLDHHPQTIHVYTMKEQCISVKTGLSMHKHGYVTNILQ